jgi:hypothetical protein
MLETGVTVIGTVVVEHDLGSIELSVVVDDLDAAYDEYPLGVPPGTWRAEGTLLLQPGMKVEHGEIVRVDSPHFRGSLLCWRKPVDGVAKLVSWGKFECDLKEQTCRPTT